MPIEIPADAPFKSIIIGGLSFNVPLPFNEGYVLRPKDAAQFNQVYHENLRNNFNKTKLIVDKGQKFVDEYTEASPYERWDISPRKG